MPKLHAVDLILSHQFEEEIGAASSENGLFIAKMEFSIQTGAARGASARIITDLHGESTSLDPFDF